MPVIRAAYQVPDLTAAPNCSTRTTRAAIEGALTRLGCRFTVFPDGAFVVDTPNAGTVHFGPGQRMLFCRSGVYPVTPVPVETLRSGDGVLGFTTGRVEDIFDAVLVLKHQPQVCGSIVRLVPDPARCHPRPYLFGITYAMTRQPAWKLAA